MGMYSVAGDSSWNFFKNVLSNHIPDPTNLAGNLAARKFATASNVVNFVGLSDLATYGEDGVKVLSPKFPFQLIFTPNSVLTAAYTDDFQATFFSQISQIASGTTVYSVSAIATPGDSPVLIGNLVLDSQPTTSSFGDRHLFFRHQDMKEDLKIEPSWKSSVSYQRVLSSGGCPFASSESYLDLIQDTATETLSYFNLI